MVFHCVDLTRNMYRVHCGTPSTEVWFDTTMAVTLETLHVCKSPTILQPCHDVLVQCSTVQCTCRQRSCTSSNLAVCVDAFVVPRYSPSSAFYSSISYVEWYKLVVPFNESCFRFSCAVCQKIIRCNVVAVEFVCNDIRRLPLLSWFQPSLPLPLVDGKRMMCSLEHIIAFVELNHHNSVVVNEFSLICWCVCMVSYILY